MAWRDLVKKITADAVASARVAIDYLDGHQLSHLETLLDTEAGIKDWRKRGVIPIWENFTQEVIEKSAMTYDQQPSREIVDNEIATDEYTARIAKLWATLDAADSVARLLKTCFILVQARDGELYMSVLSRHNCEVVADPVTREITEILYTSGVVGPHGGQVYTHWDTNTVRDIEISDGVTRIIDSQTNTYGIVPVVTLYDLRPPRVGVWSKPVWSQIVAINNALNLFQTETKFNQRFAAVGALFTNMRIPEGTVVGPDTVVEVDMAHPDETPFIEYRAPQVQITPFVDWINGLRETVGAEWGVNLKISGGGTADSGFKLVVEELPSLQLRKKRIKAAIDFERDLYRTIATVSQTIDIGYEFNPDDELVVRWPEPDLPVQKKEAWDIAKEQIATGVLSRREYLQQQMPDATADEIDKRVEEIDTERVGGIGSIGGVING